MPDGNGLMIRRNKTINALQNSLLSKHGVVQTQTPLLHEPHDAKRAELLGDTGHPEQVVWRHALLRLLIGQSIPAGINHLGSLHNTDGNARNMEIAHESIHLTVYLRVSIFNHELVFRRPLPGLRHHLHGLNARRKIIGSSRRIGPPVNGNGSPRRHLNGRHQRREVRLLRHRHAVIAVAEDGRCRLPQPGIVLRGKGKILKGSLMAGLCTHNNLGVFLRTSRRSQYEEHRGQTLCG